MNAKSFPHSWGWSPFFDAYLESQPHWHIARVINQEKGLYKIQTSDDETLLAQLSGKLSYSTTNPLAFPAVGDWIQYSFNSGDERAMIQQVLERRTCFYRGSEQVIAANVDVAFIVTSANAEMNLNRLDRYLTLCWESKAQPVIVLSKIDLCENSQTLVAEIEQRHVGVDVLAVSLQQPQTLLQLNKYLLPGQTVVLMGSSGVGKSSLANALMGGEVALTGAIRDDDQKGRHTTTSRQTYRLAGGALLMDTPGMRSLALGSHEEGLEHQFSDIVELAQSCRFSDCQHETEPGCAIRAALDSGDVDQGRWLSFLKLQREVLHEKMKEDHALLEQQRNKWKKISKDLRVRIKQKARGQV
ncbi:ribosome small subunit-dependent GTPase A [Bdellovibrio sp. NC01]|uniref:ribosome small subunit-dependent GTPase A n=1 Tax=Bdellovibrio sp. NC01 TaxID=2220073 RepID=UPI001FEF1A16|nr:ribosome small subunit-dependent GTPase A [Bdellovibrio sp. NC01]